MNEELAAALFQLRQELAAQRQQDARAFQDLAVRLQDYSVKVTQMHDALVDIVGPLPDVPTLNLNTRPRI